MNFAADGLPREAHPERLSGRIAPKEGESMKINKRLSIIMLSLYGSGQIILSLCHIFRNSLSDFALQEKQDTPIIYSYILLLIRN